MRDESIIELFFARDETAIDETRSKYGAYCSRIALNVLGVQEDAEECVSDTYLAAWNRIPPNRPVSLRAFLGRITRNIAISLFRRGRASKRFDAMETMLSELTDCIPSLENVEREVERRELGQLISDWLDSLGRRDRDLFIRRYWYGESVEALARERAEKANSLAQRLRRLRLELRKLLEMEGVTYEG